MKQPPQLADKLLRFFLSDDRLEEVLGDLHEEYRWQVNRVGERRAKWRYWRDVLGFLKPWAVKRKVVEPPAAASPTRYQRFDPYSTTSYFNPAMFRNYFRTAWRNLVKNRFYSLINMTGLTAGLAVGILILLWVQDELSFDRFHQKADAIYRLENWAGTGDSRQIWTSTVAPIAVLGKKELPEINDGVRISYNGTYTLFKYQDKTVNETGTHFADPSLFSVFDFPLIQGNSANPFPDNQSIVLTESTAKRYFGDANPIGKILASNNNSSFRVSGVVRDFPKNSSIQGDMILPISLLFDEMYRTRTDGKNKDNDFSQFDYETYLLLKPGTDLGKLTDKLRTIHLRKIGRAHV